MSDKALLANMAATIAAGLAARNDCYPLNDTSSSESGKAKYVHKSIAYASLQIAKEILDSIDRYEK